MVSASIGGAEGFTVSEFNKLVDAVVTTVRAARAPRNGEGFVPRPPKPTSGVKIPMPVKVEQVKAGPETDPEDVDIFTDHALRDYYASRIRKYLPTEAPHDLLFEAFRDLAQQHGCAEAASRAFQSLRTANWLIKDKGFAGLQYGIHACAFFLAARNPMEVVGLAEASARLFTKFDLPLFDQEKVADHAVALHNVGAEHRFEHMQMLREALDVATPRQYASVIDGWRTGSKRVVQNVLSAPPPPETRAERKQRRAKVPFKEGLQHLRLEIPK